MSRATANLDIITHRVPLEEVADALRWTRPEDQPVHITKVAIASALAGTAYLLLKNRKSPELKTYRDSGRNV